MAWRGRYRRFFDWQTAAAACPEGEMRPLLNLPCLNERFVQEIASIGSWCARTQEALRA